MQHTFFYFFNLFFVPLNEFVLSLISSAHKLNASFAGHNIYQFYLPEKAYKENIDCPVTR